MTKKASVPGTKTIVLAEIPRVRKPKPLIDPKRVRMKLLALLKEVRPAFAEQVTRVSPSVFVTLEGDLINSIKDRLRRLPSVGKTLKFD